MGLVVRLFDKALNSFACVLAITEMSCFFTSTHVMKDDATAVFITDYGFTQVKFRSRRPC